MGTEEGLNASLAQHNSGRGDGGENGQGIDFLVCSRRPMGMDV